MNSLTSLGFEKREVFYLIPPKLNVIDHQTEKKICPHCQKLQQSCFPVDVTAETQFGTKLKSWIIYFMHYQLIPFEITAEICEDLISHRPSLGSLNRFAKECYKSLKKTELNIKTSLIHSEILNVNETGINCNGKLEWLHVASNENLTIFASYKNRGM